MAKQRIPLETACPLAKSLSSIGDWWSFLIAMDACEGPRGFDEFQRNLGLTTKVLSARLKSLVARGVFEIVPPSGGAHGEYILTRKGLALLTVVFAPCQLGVFASGEHRHPTPVGGGFGQADCRMLTGMNRSMGWCASRRNIMASEMPKTAATSPSNVVKSGGNDALAALLIKPRHFRSQGQM